MAQRVNLAGTGLPIRKKTFSAKTEAVSIVPVWRASGAAFDAWVASGGASDSWAAQGVASDSWVKSVDDGTS